MIIPSIIAYVILFLGETMTNTGYASDIFVKSIAGSIGAFVGCALLSGVIGAGTAAVSGIWSKSFWPVFFKTYGIAIIAIANVFLFGGMALKTTAPRQPVGLTLQDRSPLSELELAGLKVLAPPGAKRSRKSAADGESHLLVGGGIDVVYGRVSGCEMVITHGEQTQGSFNLMDAYSRGVRDYKNLSVVSDLRSSFGEMQVSGRAAIWSEIACKMGGKAHLSRSIDVSDGRHYWGVAVLGDPSAVESIWETVKNSIRLTR